MGGWKLEAFKMTIYMAFPVGVFWWFNQPRFFEGWMMEKRKELFPPTDPQQKEDIKNAIKKMEQQRFLKMEREFGKQNS